MSILFSQRQDTRTIKAAIAQNKSQMFLTNLGIGAFGALLMPTHVPFVLYQTWDMHKTFKSQGIKKDIFAGFMHILRRDGIFSYFNGFLPYATSIIVKNELDIFKYQLYQTKGILPINLAPNTKANLLKVFFGSLSLSILGTIVSSPFWNISTRMMLDSDPVRQYNGVIDCILKIYGSEGFFGFFNGIHYDFLHDAFSSLMKVVKFYLKIEDNMSEVIRHVPNLFLTFIELNVTYPLEVLKVRKIVGYEWAEDLSTFETISDSFDGFFYHSLLVNGPSVLMMAGMYIYDNLKL